MISTDFRPAFLWKKWVPYVRVQNCRNVQKVGDVSFIIQTFCRFMHNIFAHVYKIMNISLPWGGSPRTTQGRSTRGIYNDYHHFLLLGEAPRTTRCCATHGIYNILLTVSYSREGSADHSMSIKPWNLQHICRIFLSSGKLRGPLDVMQRMEFAIYYQHFPILGRGLRTTWCWSNRGICNSLSTFPAPRPAPMTTRRRATHGIYNTLLTFPCSRGKSEHRSISIKPLILQ